MNEDNGKNNNDASGRDVAQAAGADALSDLSFVLDELIENLKYSSECGERQIELDNETAVALFSPDFVKLPFEQPAPASGRDGSAETVLPSASPNKPPAEGQGRAGAPRTPQAAQPRPSITIPSALPKLSGLPTLPSLSSRQKQVQAPRPVSSAALPAPGSSAGLGELAAHISNCRKCPLFEKRARIVSGQGNGNAPDVMFIGETPRPEEDAAGATSDGMTWGQLLFKMIAAMGYDRKDVYITNICKCRPAGGQAPSLEELSACLSILKEEIAVVRPRAIVALGGSVISALLGSADVASVRGKWHKFEGVDLMPVYHPSYLIRTPAAKKTAWEDLKSVLAKLGKNAPAPQKR